MATITSLNSTDNGSVSRGVINTNFTNLNTDKIETSYIDTDGTLAANSDVKIASQKAVKTYANNATKNVSTIVNPYKARAYKNASQSFPSGTVTKVLFDSENYDVNNNFSIVNGNYTVPVTGYYSVSARCLLVSTTNDSKILLFSNGSIISTGANLQGGGYLGLVFSDHLYFNAGDVIDVRINNGIATPVQIETGSTNAYFSIHLLSV